MEKVEKVELDTSKLYYGFPVFLLGYQDEKYGYNYTTSSSSYTLGDMLVIGIWKQGNALQKIKAAGCFTVNVPTEALMKEIEIGGFNPGDDKFSLTSKLTCSQSEKVNAPLINECVLNIECEVIKVIDLEEFGDYCNIIAKVKGRFVNPELQENGALKAGALNPILFLGDDAKRSYRYLNDQENNPGDFFKIKNRYKELIHMLKIEKQNKVYKMDKKNTPVAKVESGTEILFEMSDAFNDQITSETQEISQLDWSSVNPATGPVYIEGAEVGDVLKVQIQEINIESRGVTAAIPNAGLLGDKVTTPEVKVLEIKDGYVQFNDQIKVPINPMIGVIGVAPAGKAIPCGTPDAHGGNMDNKKIAAGTTLYFPVFAEGALLAMGDLHAAMGDGEIMVTGLEIAGSVKVKVEVIKGKSIDHPILETDRHFYTIASHKDLLEAVKISTLEMQKIVMEKLDLSFNEAGMLLSMTGDAEIAQVVDPLLTARFGMSKDILPEVF